jgi:NAD(P)-dependent dehydrogenase (short-subunit alcohol dehydrogenase family)
MKRLAHPSFGAAVVHPSDLRHGSSGQEQLIDGVVRDTAGGRLAEPADVAGVVAMFASPEGAWLTGQHVEANGRFRWS